MPAICAHIVSQQSEYVLLYCVWAVCSWSSNPANQNCSAQNTAAGKMRIDIICIQLTPSQLTIRPDTSASCAKLFSRLGLVKADLTLFPLYTIKIVGWGWTQFNLWVWFASNKQWSMLWTIAFQLFGFLRVWVLISIHLDISQASTFSIGKVYLEACGLWL